MASTFDLPTRDRPAQVADTQIGQGSDAWRTSVTRTIRRRDGTAPTEFAAQRLSMTDDDLLAAYWRFHPRFPIFQDGIGRRRNPGHRCRGGRPASVEDMARSGPPDIKVFAVDRARAPTGHDYVAWENIDLDTALPEFRSVTFDAAILSHIVEHLADPRGLIAWLATRLRPGGRLYLEWPSETSARQPSREALPARASTSSYQILR